MKLTTQIRDGYVSTTKLPNGTFETIVFSTHPGEQNTERAGVSGISNLLLAKVMHQSFVRRYNNKLFWF